MNVTSTKSADLKMRFSVGLIHFVELRFTQELCTRLTGITFSESENYIICRVQQEKVSSNPSLLLKSAVCNRYVI